MTKFVYVVVLILTIKRKLNQGVGFLKELVITGELKKAAQNLVNRALIQPVDGILVGGYQYLCADVHSSKVA
jgi:hypothetical protein